jgi:exodeoxyribonuclease VII large subunit
MEQQTSLFNLMPERRIWKVSEITARIRSLLEGALADISVEGEVSNCRIAQSGHAYFTLKDAKSQIKCVCFREQMRGLKFKLEDGLHITVRGSIGVYEQRGEYQIYVQTMEPVGLGALQLAFEQLKKKLAAEGLFDQARKKPLPLLPSTIGVITSPTGAAIRDILRVLKRRHANAHVQIYPVKVQGTGAAEEIVEALRYFHAVRCAEVIIIARGGGSLEDLWAFNEEVLARAIFAAEIPIISGVGHEIDFTIADFVADLRAPTPSAAAELVVRSREEFDGLIRERQRQLAHHIRYRLSQWKHHARDLQTHRGFRQLESLLRSRRQHVDDMAQSLSVGMRLRLAMARQRVTDANARVASFDLRSRAEMLRRRIDQRREALRAAMDRIVARKRRTFVASQVRFAALDLGARVGKLRAQLERSTAELQVRIDRLLVARRRRLESGMMQLDERSPLNILKRGFAIAYDASGKVLRSAEQVAIGDEIAVRLERGELGATVRRKS